MHTGTSNASLFAVLSGKTVAAEWLALLLLRFQSTSESFSKRQMEMQAFKRIHTNQGTFPVSKFFLYISSKKALFQWGQYSA